MSKPKEYPLDINTLDDCDSVTAYYSKGHHNPMEFVDKVRAELHTEIKTGQVRHELGRWTPHRDPCDAWGNFRVYLDYPCESGRGVFPVTVAEV